MSLSGQTVQDILIAIGLIGGTVIYYVGRLPRQTIKDLKEHSAAQDKLIEDLRSTREGLVKDIADLQGQIKVYKELPLRDLAEGIKKIGESNQMILTTLQASAVISPKDGVEATIKTGTAK